MKSKNRQEWILLIHQLPTKPTNLRVRIWRKLQNFGAVLIKNSVYILPSGEKTNEDFQWLKQEIESAGGEATVFRADSVEGATDCEIIALFREQRETDYARLIGDFEGLSGAVREQKKSGSLSANKLSQYEAELGKLSQELERILATDFFRAASRNKAQAAFEKFRKQLQAAKGAGDKALRRQNDSARLNPAEYQNRRWVTRKNPHIDRMASGWLIKRFVDSRPRFGFVADGEPVDGGALTFDMVGAHFTHQGEDCTFETLIKSFGLEDDAALRQIAEIVHDIDLKDKKFNRLEAAGVNAVVRGIAAVYADDNERLKHGFPLFDGLYQLFGSSEQPVESEEKK
ncbi:MAG: Chromate resistance protein ChrB [uncultured Pyrinomonadaceae bacterium]|uniref:Chromate resistance protein ChrB n=1 Tax=uncultured Pyrinomonadaceae bacterium TaxID=2283094 RepID=A0A6J4Q3K8_9BACT|nr:MAG: Chromate resistance protein ChrB [uncultured Pyrinomonadaceae bacterium]